MPGKEASKKGEKEKEEKISQGEVVHLYISTKSFSLTRPLWDKSNQAEKLFSVTITFLHMAHAAKAVERTGSKADQIQQHYDIQEQKQRSGQSSIEQHFSFSRCTAAGMLDILSKLVCCVI